jgi:hypothetical protein
MDFRQRRPVRRLARRPLRQSVPQAQVRQSAQVQRSAQVPAQPSALLLARRLVQWRPARWLA